MVKNSNVKCLFAFCFIACFSSCNQGADKSKEPKNKEQAMTETEYSKGSFGYDLNFVRQYQNVVVLKDALGSAQVLACPEYQGRVLTSTATGAEGRSFGYLNYGRIGSKKQTPQIQSYGGEDRFWIGPQGGQYAIFFKKGDPFDLNHWETPAPLDKEAFELVSHNDTMARFSKKMELKNFSGTAFNVEVKRDILLLNKDTVSAYLGVNVDEVKFVGFESRNELINTGKEAWEKSKGLLSIWILGMFPGNTATNIVIPYKSATGNKQIVSEYFTDIVGRLPNNRLKQADRIIYYKGDGNYCSKIGLKRKHALAVFGSYSAADTVLTIVQYTLPDGENDYVNSSFEFQKEPYQGDVINSYNDGTLDHKPTTPTFYELESSSPAKELQPHESIKHIHRTFHFSGNKATLDVLAKAILGVGLKEIEEQFR